MISDLRPLSPVMHRACTAIRMCRIATSAAVLWGFSAAAQQPNAGTLAHSTSGITVTSATAVLRVDALRADVLRVRMERVGHPAEDASWAVLPEARTAHIAVKPEESGFSTSALRVTVGQDGQITVADLAGHVLQQDAVPTCWDGAGFRVTKQKTADDHFFGLGDKPGLPAL